MLIREAPFCSRMLLIQRSTTDQHEESKIVECSVLNKTSLWLPPLRIIDYLKGEGGRMVRNRGSGYLQRNRIFQTRQHHHTHELIVVVTACTRSSQDWSIQNLRMNGRGAHETPHLLWGTLLAVEGGWGESVFFSDGAPQRLSLFQ